MFYGAYVLSKKGPLAKVWLAAHWDKKLTKAHVFETDVSATVEDIISPKVRMALRTSGHLLLGVVRIYSRKQKYLIHDLGEACAKIRMAFRPGIVDLPSEGGVANADAITLPEIFHDFETAVADLGSLGMEEQFTINRSRVAEITIAEDLTSVGPAGNDPFLEYGDFGDEFGKGIEDQSVDDVEKIRKNITFEEENRTGRDSFQLTGDRSSTLLPDAMGRATVGQDLELDDEKLPDRNDFGGENFLEDLEGLGLQEGLGELPNIVDSTLEAQAGVQQEGVEEGGAEKAEAAVEGEEPMEVDGPPEEQTIPAAANQAAEPDTALAPAEEEGEFILEPVDITSALDTSTKGKKRKRKLVVDTDKEFTSEMIRSQLQDYSDTLQQKLFPPPTKRAMLWKDMTTCEQLFQRPVLLFAAPEVLKTVTRNYLSKLRNEPANESLVDLDPETAAGVRAVSAEVEKGRGEAGGEREAVEEDAAAPLNITDTAKDTTLPSEIEHYYGAVEDGGRPNNVDDVPIEGGVILDEQASRVIPEMPDLEGVTADEVSAQTTGDEKSNAEMSEEFEKRRWTKRTQQVLRILDRCFSSHPDMPFSSLTQKCSRKQAASRFYTCLLLAKENTIHVEQAQAYGEITISRGPKFTEAF